jgi:hypothetical protein
MITYYYSHCLSHSFLLESFSLSSLVISLFNTSLRTDGFERDYQFIIKVSEQPYGVPPSASRKGHIHGEWRKHPWRWPPNVYNKLLITYSMSDLGTCSLWKCIPQSWHIGALQFSCSACCGKTSSRGGDRSAWFHRSRPLCYLGPRLLLWSVNLEIRYHDEILCLNGFLYLKLYICINRCHSF